MTVVGLLGHLLDPEVRAQIFERQRIIDQLAKQMGCSPQEARWALESFEGDLSHEGHAKN